MKAPAIFQREARKRLFQGIAFGGAATMTIGFRLGRLDDGGECQNYASRGGEQWPDVCPSTPVRRAIHSHGWCDGQIQDKQRLCQGKSGQRGREKRCVHEYGLRLGEGLREQH